MNGREPEGRRDASSAAASRWWGVKRAGEGSVAEWNGESGSVVQMKWGNNFTLSQRKYFLRIALSPLSLTVAQRRPVNPGDFNGIHVPK